jgi:hypothetical protein
MNEIKDGGPAFPCDEQIRDSMIYQPERGMSLRDYFAAKAMQSRLSAYESLVPLHEYAKDTGQEFAKVVADQSYDMADAMLRARGAE